MTELKDRFYIDLTEHIAYGRAHWIQDKTTEIHIAHETETEFGPAETHENCLTIARVSRWEVAEVIVALWNNHLEVDNNKAQLLLEALGVIE